MTDVIQVGGTSQKSSSGGWLGLAAGIGLLALGGFALLKGKSTKSANNAGGGYSESLGGGSGDGAAAGTGSGTVTTPTTNPTGTVNVGSLIAQQGNPMFPAGSAVSVFEQASNGALFGMSEKVLSLHGDVITANRVTAGNPYGNLQLGFVDPNTMNAGYGARTDVSDIAGSLGSLPVDYSGVGFGTYWYADGQGNTTVQVRDGRLYQSNFADAVKEVAGDSRYAGMSSDDRVSIAASLALGRALDSVGDLGSMGAADRARYDAYKGSATSVFQQAQVAAAVQTNANLATRQQEAKAAEAVRQAEANRQSALAAQQSAQAAKSGGSGGSFGGSATSQFYNQYVSKSSGGSGGATATAAGGKTTSGSGGSSGKASYNDRSGSKSGWSTTSSGQKVH